jgi:hypothetical protein
LSDVKRVGGAYETSPPKFSTSGRRRRRRRPAGRIPHGEGASLSDAAGAYCRRISSGWGADLFARLVGQWLSERLGQQFLIENRPGAAGNIATEAVVRASADGYTLLW